MNLRSTPVRRWSALAVSAVLIAVAVAACKDNAHPVGAPSSATVAPVVGAPPVPVVATSASPVPSVSKSPAAAGPKPCDIYVKAGTPCVAAHSVTRALFAGFGGKLYQVTRSSDGAKRDIGLLAAGGYANAAAQDAFCAGKSCVISKIYDQTARHNDLTPAPGGTANPNADRGADASALSVTLGGHKVYALWVTPGVGYRYTGVASGVAVNGQAEGVYMVASGTHVGADCCFDYGNAERTAADTGNGHMAAVSIATTCYFPPCSGSGPWVEGDLENGMFQGANGSNLANKGNPSQYVTAMLKTDGQKTYALKGGDSQRGRLTTWWDGALPDRGGYSPLQQEGGIILGIGGDNSNGNRGTFFEGVMTRGKPTNAADDAVQANIVAAGYQGVTDGTDGVLHRIAGPAGKCVDVNGDDTGADEAPVDLWDCQSAARDQKWSRGSGDTLQTLGRCLDIANNGTANGAAVELWDCNGVGGQKWVGQGGALKNPQSGKCLEARGGATGNGTRLQIRDCTGSGAQKFVLRSA